MYENVKQHVRGYSSVVTLILEGNTNNISVILIVTY